MKPAYASHYVGVTALALALTAPWGTTIADQGGGLPATNARVGALEGRATQLEGRTTQLEGRTTQLEGRATATEAKLHQHDDELADHKHRIEVLENTPTSATISFGGWSAGTTGAVNTLNGPTDRHQTVSPLGANVHRLNPSEVTIKAGGSVRFIIAGGHQVAVYQPGMTTADVLAGQVNFTTVTDPVTGVVTTNFLSPVDSPTGRLYRGLDGAVLRWVGVAGPQGAQTVAVTPAAGATLPNLAIPDRTEVVYFPTPGRYLVACMVRPHLIPNQGGPGMFGFVNVE